MDILSEHLRSLIESVSRVIDDGSIGQDTIEALGVKAERVHYLMAALVDVIPGVDASLRLIESVITSLNGITSLIVDNSNNSSTYAFSAPRFISGERGRPRVVISQEILEYLIGNHFNVHQVAQLLQTSTSTVRRRMREYGITVRSTYSLIDDVQLDTLVRELQNQYPNCGYRLMRGHLAAMGYRIQESRVRDALRRVDPLGVMSRWIRSIHRRTHSVAGPNALWHIDGNHKLIRWKLVIHAGIDGYSRLPVYCYCSSNNEAQTVLTLFLDATESFGLPSRVRCDRGGENSLVGYYMLNHPLRGIGRGSIISGRSVHNQRIERFWRDLFTGCTSLFYHLFYHLEDTGLLNSDDPVHLWCLHLIYRPYINASIANFIDGWACHPMSSTNGLSPRQLWMQGMLRNYNSGHRVTDEIYGDQADNYVSYGVDWNEPIPDSDDGEQVDVPIINRPPTVSEMEAERLLRLYTLDRIVTSEYHATDLYVELVDHVTLMLL